MFKIRASLFCLGWLVATVPALASGSVELNFVKTDQYADIGRSVVERERHLAVLSDHLKRLGQRLPDGQVLTIEVLDVDLAGEAWPTRHLNDVRVLEGSIDWPRMHLRWTLQAGGRTLRSGDDRLSDAAYLMTSARLGMNQALAHDLRMIDDWFGKTFASEAPH
jgi:hypothetical protein